MSLKDMSSVSVAVRCLTISKTCNIVTSKKAYAQVLFDSDSIKVKVFDKKILILV
jgi:hypothetical protein